MPNLLVEIGNTALKAAWSEGMTLGKTFRYQGEKMFEFVESLVGKEKPAVMVISSTIKVDKNWEERFKKYCRNWSYLTETTPKFSKDTGSRIIFLLTGRLQ